MPTVDTSRQEKKRGRPRKKTEPVRPVRIPLGSYRDILTVHGKDPNFYYRWVKDVSENGSEILNYLRAGFTHVNSDEVRVGEDKVDKGSSLGSIVVLKFKGETHYLMKQPMEYREEDVAMHHQRVDETEQHILNPHLDPEDTDKSEQFGDITVKHQD